MLALLVLPAFLSAEGAIMVGKGVETVMCKNRLKEIERFHVEKTEERYDSCL